jgi:hypothetical protein
MSKAGKRLIKAAKEMVSIAKGEADPTTYNIHYGSSLDSFLKEEGILEEVTAAAIKRLKDMNKDL